MNARKSTWCFTAWEEPKVDDARVRAIGWGIEICPTTKKQHWQGMIQFEKHVRFTVVKKLLPPTTHIEPMRGTVEQSLTYCKKEGAYSQVGEFVAQGQRVDIDDAVAQIRAGKSVLDIARENPAVHARCARTLELVEDAELLNKFRTEMTEGLWLWGPSGVGKSHRAFEGFKPETHYVKNLADQWWDGYRGQEVILLNDFRGQLRYGEILELVDKWPHTLKRRGRQPVPCMAKKVIVTCSMPPEKLFAAALKRDGADQILRRFTVVKMDGGPGGNTNPQDRPKMDPFLAEEIEGRGEWRRVQARGIACGDEELDSEDWGLAALEGA